MSSGRSRDELKPTAAKYPWPSIQSLLRTMGALALGYILLLAYLHYQGDPDIRRIFGGSRGLAILNHAERVEAYRINKLPEKFDFDFDKAVLADYPILSGPKPVPQSDVQTLRHTLQDRESYDWKA